MTALTYADGYGDGFWFGCEYQANIQDAVRGLTLAVFDSPRRDKLRAERDQILTTPCRQSCRRCSRCIRYAAWWRNGRRDFLGVAKCNTSAVAS